MKDSFTDKEVGIVMYEAILALGPLQGFSADEGPDLHWEDLTVEEQEEIGTQLASTVNRLRAGKTVQEVQDLWCEDAKREGWHYGPELDSDLGTDPRLVKWEDLPDPDKRQIALSLAIVKAMTDAPVQ